MWGKHAGALYVSVASEAVPPELRDTTLRRAQAGAATAQAHLQAMGTPAEAARAQGAHPSALSQCCFVLAVGTSVQAPKAGKADNLSQLFLLCSSQAARVKEEAPVLLQVCYVRTEKQIR